MKKLLAEITEESLGIEITGAIFNRDYKIKRSARGVIINNQGDVAIQYVGRHKFYKLPGGGIDVGETLEQGFKREVREEVGCDILVEHELGVTMEYRTKMSLLQIGYGFIARVVGEVGEPQWEQDELEDDYQSLWLPLDEVIQKIELAKTSPDLYQGGFIIAREHAFLEEARRVLEGVSNQ